MTSDPVHLSQLSCTEQLIDLGQDLAHAISSQLQPLGENWLESAALKADDCGEYLTLMAQVQAMGRLQTDLLAWIAQITTGFVPPGNGSHPGSTEALVPFQKAGDFPWAAMGQRLSSGNETELVARESRLRQTSPAESGPSSTSRESMAADADDQAAAQNGESHPSAPTPGAGSPTAAAATAPPVSSPQVKSHHPEVADVASPKNLSQLAQQLTQQAWEPPTAQPTDGIRQGNTAGAAPGLSPRDTSPPNEPPPENSNRPGLEIQELYPSPVPHARTASAAPDRRPLTGPASQEHADSVNKAVLQQSRTAPPATNRPDLPAQPSFLSTSQSGPQKEGLASDSSRSLGQTGAAGSGPLSPARALPETASRTEQIKLLRQRHAVGTESARSQHPKAPAASTETTQPLGELAQLLEQHPWEPTSAQSTGISPGSTSQPIATSGAAALGSRTSLEPHDEPMAASPNSQEQHRVWQEPAAPAHPYRPPPLDHSGAELPAAMPDSSTPGTQIASDSQAPDQVSAAVQPTSAAAESLPKSVQALPDIASRTGPTSPPQRRIPDVTKPARSQHPKAPVSSTETTQTLGALAQLLEQHPWEPPPAQAAAIQNSAPAGKAPPSQDIRQTAPEEETRSQSSAPGAAVVPPALPGRDCPAEAVIRSPTEALPPEVVPPGPPPNLLPAASPLADLAADFPDELLAQLLEAVESQVNRDYRRFYGGSP